MNISRASLLDFLYSTIAWIPEAQGSWALPLLHERISSWSSPIEKAASQLKLVCEQSINPVLAVLDREYGNASWVLAVADIQADCLMRVRSNACLWSAPPAYSGRGRPRKHGQKMRLSDATTWLEADNVIEIDEHPDLGPRTSQSMAGLTFLSCRWTKSQFNPHRKNEAHVKLAAVSTFMVGLGRRANSTLRNCLV